MKSEVRGRTWFLQNSKHYSKLSQKGDMKIQCVPFATETGISLIILPLMRILQRNLKLIYLIV